MLHEETPQYKIQASGCANLTDVEVFAGIICNGDTPAMMAKAIAISRELLNKYKDIHSVVRLHLSDLTTHMTKSQALRLMSAFEMSRRRLTMAPYNKPKVSSSRDAFNAINGDLCDLNHEEFWIICLSKSNEIVCKKRMSSGGSSGTIADVKMIFKAAINEPGTAAIIAVHNHPSGNLKPSDADNELTRKIKSAGLTLDLPVLDHLIVSQRGYYSYADEGMI